MSAARSARRATLALIALSPIAGRATLAAPSLPEGLAVAAARASALRDEAVRRGDQPYGAVVVKDGRIVGEGASAVVLRRDPDAHAERVAIADAVAQLGPAGIEGAVLVGSSRACAACSAAAFHAGIVRLYHGATPADDGPPVPPR